MEILEPKTQKWTPKTYIGIPVKMESTILACAVEPYLSNREGDGTPHLELKLPTDEKWWQYWFPPEPPPRLFQCRGLTSYQPGIPSDRPAERCLRQGYLRITFYAKYGQEPIGYQEGAFDYSRPFKGYELKAASVLSQIAARYTTSG